MITVSDLIEYQFCKRFTYFMHCLKINQREDKRYKVLKGREVHKQKEDRNKNYLRKKIGAVEKDASVYLSSKKYNFVGIIDEVLELENGSFAPFDYKFAEYKENLFTTHKYQSYLYAELIRDTYKKEVKKGYICYVRSNNLVKEIEYTEKEFIKVINTLEDINKIITTGYFPKATSSKAKCIDCCYRNICTCI